MMMMMMMMMMMILCHSPAQFALTIFVHNIDSSTGYIALWHANATFLATRLAGGRGRMC